jgi:hypothetical protein
MSRNGMRLRPLWTGLAVVVAGCLGPGDELGFDVQDGYAADLPDIPVVYPPPSHDPIVGASCRPNEPGKFCLGVKYVVFKDANDNPVLSEAQALNNVQKMNSFYEKCRIAFQLDKFIIVNPSDHSQRFHLRGYEELDQLRNTFGDSRSLLVVTTGSWDRSGPIGNTGANAWTSLPGEGPYGAILEASVGNFPNIVAHEIGHYLNLLHVQDSTALMNKIIYAKSTTISDLQCTGARRAVAYYWQAMLR